MKNVYVYRRCIWGAVSNEGRAYNLGVSTGGEGCPEGALCEAGVYTPEPCRLFSPINDESRDSSRATAFAVYTMKIERYQLPLKARTAPMALPIIREPVSKGILR